MENPHEHSKQHFKQEPAYIYYAMGIKLTRNMHEATAQHKIFKIKKKKLKLYS